MIAVIEIDSVDELPKDVPMWNTVTDGPGSAASEIERRTGDKVKEVYKLKGHRQYFIVFDKEAYESRVFDKRGTK